MLLLVTVVPGDPGLVLQALGQLVNGGTSPVLSQQLLEEANGRVKADELLPPTLRVSWQLHRLFLLAGGVSRIIRDMITACACYGRGE